MTKARFLHNWMYAGFITGVFLLALIPLFAGGWSLALVLVYLQLPIYMVHQLEEHHGDRFRHFVNDELAKGKDALTTPAVVVINVGGVWLVNLTVLYLARFVDIGLGLIAVYLTLVNALVHIAGAVALRRYNPGLATAIVLFLPVSIVALISVSRAPGVGVGDQILALACAVLLHVAIILHVRRRAAMLAA